MKIFNSIKWRLQLWYGLILLTVLAGLGVAAYELERGKTYRQVDNELHRRLNALTAAMRGPQMQRPPRRGPDDFEPPMAREFPNERRGPAFTQPAPGDFHLLPRDEFLFDARDPNGFYFIVIGRDGTEVARSTNAPPLDAVTNALTGEAGMPAVEGRALNLPRMPAGGPGREPDQAAQWDGAPGPGRMPLAPSPPRMRGSFREVQMLAPPSGVVLVGRNVRLELNELRRFGFELAGVGLAVLFLGLAGGWWISSRSLRPIAEISGTATKIAAGDLSQRISAAETEDELGQLAAVLNSTFARLETAFAQQKQFAADAAHELRTPVSVMLTQTQTALTRERDAASYRQTVEACQRAAQRMRRLIESLLELARFDAGQEVLQRARIDFSKTVSDCTELVRTLADERNVKIRYELPPLEITGDAERLAQVVTNLLTNAIQYNKPGGEVRVNLESQNGLAVLTVTDTGQGIAAENLPRLFTRFFRADASRTGAGNAGLGLAICKAIVDAHGGTIEVASQTGIGSAFTVRLPCEALKR